MAPNPANLAAAIREVNAAHAAAGSPALPELEEAWITLDRSFSLATVAGDDVAAAAAVERYRARSLAAIAKAAK